MADVILTDGTEITFDLSKITWKEHVAIISPEEDNAVSYAKIARVAGLEPEALENMSILEHKKIVRGYFRKVQEPLLDPN